MYYGGYNSYGSPIDSFMSYMVAPIVISLILALLIFFIFLAKRNDHQFGGFLGWLYEFLSFRSMLVEALLKILYMFVSFLIIIYGFIVMFQDSFLAGLIMIPVGLVISRIIFEFLLINVIICRNTSDINNKTAGKGGSAGNSKPARNVSEPAPRTTRTRTSDVNDEAPVRTRRTAPAPAPAANVCSCGNKLKPGAKFCPVCGNRVGQ